MSGGGGVVTGVGFLRCLSWCMLCVRGVVFDMGVDVVGTERLESYYALLRILVEGGREGG